MKPIQRICAMILALALLLGAAPSPSVSAADEPETAAVVTTPEVVAADPADAVEATEVPAPPAEGDPEPVLPSAYNAKELGYMTPSKSQEDSGLCWDFAALGATEAYMNKYRVNGALSYENLSEYHAAYSALKPNHSAHPLLQGDYADRNNTSLIDFGGYEYYVGNSMMAWEAPLSETFTALAWADGSSADSWKHIYETPDLDTFNGNLAAVHGQNYFSLPMDGNMDQIKRLLLEYGAGTTTFRTINSFWSFSNYYYDGSDYPSTVPHGSHALVLCGWDDDYSRENFGNKLNGPKPSGNGAWICKNTRGSTALYEGYIFISYENVGFGDASFFSVEPINNFDNNYQYDGIVYENQKKLKSFSEAINVFTAEGDELLEAVAVNTGKDFSYVVNIYTDLPEHVTQPPEPTCQLSGSFTEAGYYTVRLDSPVVLKAGERFAVGIVNNSYSPNNIGFLSDGGGVFGSYHQPRPNTSFLFDGMEWTEQAGSFRIKAYTKNLDRDVDPKTVSDGVYILSPAENTDFCLTASLKEPEAYLGSRSENEQAFVLRSDPYGFYTLQSLSTGEYLTAGEVLLHYSGKSGRTDQLWRIVPNGDGLRIYSPVTGQSLCWAGTAPRDEAYVTTAGCTTADSQKWMLTPYTCLPDGVYEIKNLAAPGTVYYIDLTAASNGYCTVRDPLYGGLLSPAGMPYSADEAVALGEAVGYWMPVPNGDGTYSVISRRDGYALRFGGSGDLGLSLCVPASEAAQSWSITPHAHRPGGGARTIPSTCLEQGRVYADSCLVCGVPMGAAEQLPLGDHSPVSVPTKAPTCTVEGVSAHTECSVCGRILGLAQLLLPLGHSFTVFVNKGLTHAVQCERCDEFYSEAHRFADGVCVCGATQVHEDSTLTFSSSSISLEDEIIYYVVANNSVFSGYDRCYVEFRDLDSDDERMSIHGLIDGTPLTAKRTIFEFPIYVCQMTDRIEATLCGERGGMIFRGQPLVRSVEEFVLALLPRMNEKQREMSVNMLEFGAAMQNNFRYRTEHLANDELGDYASLVDLSIPEASGTYTTTSNGDDVLTLNRRAMGVSSVIELQYDFVRSQTVDLDDLCAKVVVGRKTFDLGSESFLTAGKHIYVIFRDLLPTQADVDITVTLYSKSTGLPVSQTVTDRLSYAVASYQNASDAVLVRAVNSLLTYYRLAEEAYR